VWNVNLSNRGYPMMAAEWMFAEATPSDDMIVWTLKSFPWSMVVLRSTRSRLRDAGARSVHR